MIEQDGWETVYVTKAPTSNRVVTADGMGVPYVPICPRCGYPCDAYGCSYYPRNFCRKGLKG